MSELSKYPAREKRFLDAFPSEYNKLHAPVSWGPVQRPGKIELGWDYRWPSPTRRGAPLEVQHTEAATDADLERVHADNSHRFNQGICDHLKSAGHRGYVVVIGAADTPRNPRDLQTALKVICSEINRAIAAGIAAGGTARGDVPWRTRRQKSVFEVEVSNDGRDFQSTSLFSATPNGYYENTTWRLSEAVRLKSTNQAKTDVVLLIDYDISGFDAEDTPGVISELDGMDIPFREVWAADLGQHTKIVRVWS